LESAKDGAVSSVITAQAGIQKVHLNTRHEFRYGFPGLDSRVRWNDVLVFPGIEHEF